jgi:hypothetical protein
MGKSIDPRIDEQEEIGPDDITQGDLDLLLSMDPPPDESPPVPSVPHNHD